MTDHVLLKRLSLLRFSYLFEYVLRGSYLLYSTKTFWLKWDFLFHWLFFFLAFMASTVAFTDWHQHMFSWHPLFMAFVFMATHFIFASLHLWPRGSACEPFAFGGDRTRAESSVLVPSETGFCGQQHIRLCNQQFWVFCTGKIRRILALQAFGQTCAGFYIVTLRFRIVDTPSIASERDLDFHMEHSD